MKPSKVIAKAKVYNGHKDVLFMMLSDDDRWADGNYTKIADGKYSKGLFTTDTGEVYAIFCDWSAKKIS